MKVNFFWSGDNFTEFDALCVKSHIKVGHDVIVWLNGKTPRSQFWVSDCDIRNASDIFDVSKFLSEGGNFQTASALWRFNLLYEYGGLYCDTDAFALKHFPEDSWIVCSAEENKKYLSTGVLKTPPKQKLFLECIKNIKHKWGNVAVFSKAYENIFGTIESTHDDRLFYPWVWSKWDELLKNNVDISECYSVHLYNTMLKRNNVVYGKTIKPSILNDLIDFVG